MKKVSLFVFFWLFLYPALSVFAQPTERLLHKAYIYSVKGKWEKAFKKLNTILTDDSLHFDALLLQGDMLLRTNRLQEAYATGRLLSQHYPDSLASWLFLAEVQTALDSLPQAEQALFQAYRLQAESPEVHMQLGILYAQAGIDSAAIKHLDYAYEALPAASALRQEVLFHLGMLALEQDKVEQALGYFNQTIQEAPHFYLAYVGKAYCQYLRGRPQESLQLLSKVEQKAPYLLTQKDYVLWAKSLYSLKQRNKAIKVLRLLPEPLPPEGYQLLARMLYESKNYEEALAYLQKAIPLAQTPQTLGSLFHDQALIYLALKEPNKALNSYSEALYLWYPIAQKEKQKEHQGVLQTCLYDAGKLLTHYFSADTLEQIRREQWHELALTLLYEGKAQEAEKVCQQLIALSPDDGLAYQYQGMALLLQNRASAAEKALFNALQSRGADSALVYELLAECAIAQEDIAKALHYIDLSLKIAPHEPDALHLKAYIYSLKQDYTTACQWANLALQYAPHEQEIRKDAMRWATAANICEQAQEHASLLLETQVYALEAWVCKAHCALIAGNITQAEGYYQNAAAIDKNHPEVKSLHQALQESKEKATAGQ